MGNYNSQVIDVTNIDNEGPIFVSGGNVSVGSISEAKFTDVSTPITVYYKVETTKTTPSANKFVSTTRTFVTSCATTYYAYAKAVDNLGNYTIKFLGQVTSASCCDEGTWGEQTCNSIGWYEKQRFNGCLGKYEYENTFVACETDDDCDSWSECGSDGTKTKECSYYYGGKKYYYDKEKECTYDPPKDDEEECDWMCQMNENQNAWHDTDDQGKKDELHEENEKIAEENCPNCDFDSESGKWYDEDGKEIPIYGDDKN